MVTITKVVSRCALIFAGVRCCLLCDFGGATGRLLSSRQSYLTTLTPSHQESETSIAQQAGSNVRLKGSLVSKSASSPFMCFYSPSFLSHTLCDYNRIINRLCLADRKSTQKSPTARTCSGLLESASIR